ncbi:MAG: methylated-DNA--[protein]-cysteine S-methyltransferase [Phormidesmis sp.]
MSIYSSENYNRIARAIAFMRQHHLEQPDLAAVAQHVALSEHYFQRMFTEWAGISPKRFLQYLTVEYAKSKITHASNLLDLTSDIGLSSPGRLHDLFVNLEAMSPGEFKSGGQGLVIRYGIHDTPFGNALIATTARGICNLRFLERSDPQAVAALFREAWPNAGIVSDRQTTHSLCKAIFSPFTGPTDSAASTSQKPLNLMVKGTNFQIQVWRALLRVPAGELTTYRTIAEMINRPTAARAVGNAIGSNPVGYLIPCHRVIRESGELGGYRWGVVRKTAILGWEAGHW